VSRDPVVAIAGVTGAVGGEFIATLNKRGFPVRNVGRSFQGLKIEFGT